MPGPSDCPYASSAHVDFIVTSRSESDVVPADHRAEIDEAKARALAGGSTARWPTKMPVRNRLDVLLDPGSWVEDGLLAQAEAGDLPADGVLTGVGTVEGRSVAVIAHDFGVKAGSWGAATCEKQVRILERADRDLLPVFYLVDSAG